MNKHAFIWLLKQSKIITNSCKNVFLKKKKKKKKGTIRTIFKIPSKVISLILWKPYRKNQGRQEQGKNEEQESIHCQITGDSSQRMSAAIARKRQFYTEPPI